MPEQTNPSTTDPKPNIDYAADYLKYIVDLGYKAEIDADADIKFESESNTYFLILDDRDPVFFRLAYPNFFPLESDEDRRRGLEAANYANRLTKVAKVTVTAKNNVWASIEMFLPEKDDFKKVFPRSFETLRKATSRFLTQVMSKDPSGLAK